jgi:hypothetical protein
MISNKAVNLLSNKAASPQNNKPKLEQELDRLKLENSKLLNINHHCIMNSIKGNNRLESAMKIYETNFSRQTKDKDHIIDSKYEELEHLYQILGVVNKKIDLSDEQKLASFIILFDIEGANENDWYN